MPCTVRGLLLYLNEFLLKNISCNKPLTGICKACRNDHKAAQGVPTAEIEQSTTVIHTPEYQLAPAAQPSTSYSEPSSPIEVSVLYFYDSSRIIMSSIKLTKTVLLVTKKVA